MTYYLKIVILLITLVFNVTLLGAQHQDHSHVHSKNEIGISGGSVYSIKHEEWGVGTHIHYFRTLGDHSKWSVGGEFESIWTDDHHFSIGGGVKYQILENWSLSLLPGITFYKHDTAKYESCFSLHFETAYDLFYWKNLHFGPALDYSWSKEDTHVSIGLHAAYCF